MVQPTGGMSSPTQGSVIVTPSGKVVGTAYVPASKGGGTSPEQAKKSVEEQATIKAEAETKAKAEAEAREKARRERIVRISGIRGKLTREERASVRAREEIRASGRGRTRREVQKYIRERGGSVSSLRSAGRKGYKITKEQTQSDARMSVAPPQVTQTQSTQIAPPQRFSVGLPVQAFKGVVQKGGAFVSKQLQKPFKVTISPFGIRYGQPLESRIYEKATGKDFPLAKTVTSAQALEQMQEGGAFSRAVGLVYPSTKGQLATQVGIGAAIVSLPPVVQSGVGFVTAGVGAKMIDEGQTKEEKIVGAGMFVGGLTGGTFAIKPFVKGRYSQLLGAKGSKTQTTPTETSIPKPIGPKLFGPVRQTVETMKGTVIGLVQRGKGFGFTRGEQQQFIGREAYVTTSARGLVGGRGGRVVVQEGPEGMGLFLSQTPEELGPSARVSRLGLAPNPFKIPSIKSQLSLTGERPQIAFGKRRIENIGYAASGELETTIGPKSVIDLTPEGKVVVEGQSVETFRIKSISEAPSTVKTTPIKTPQISPTAPITVSFKPTKPISTKQTQETISAQPSSPISPSIKVSPTQSITSTYFGGRGGTPTTSPPIKTTQTISPIITPSITTTVSPPVRPPQTPPTILEPPTTTRRLSRRKKKKKRRGLFTVEVRRGGEFKQVGQTRDLQKAVNIGRDITASTLARTFRIKGDAGSVKAPKGFRLPKATSKLRGPRTFVEKSAFALSLPREKLEIKTARRKKR